MSQARTRPFPGAGTGVFHSLSTSRRPSGQAEAARPQGRGHRRRAVVPLRVPRVRDVLPARRLGGGESVHEDLTGPAVMVEARRSAGRAREAARQPRRAPVRRASASAREARDVDERLRKQGRGSRARPRCRRTAGAGPGPARGTPGPAPAGSGMTKRESLQARCGRENRRSCDHPIQRSRAAGLNAPGRRPPGASQVPPCSATRPAGPCPRCRGTAGSGAPRPGGPGAGARRGPGAP